MAKNEESKRHLKLREELTELVGADRAMNMLTAIDKLESDYLTEVGDKLGAVLTEGRKILTEDSPTDGSTKDFDKAGRLLGSYFLQELICDHLGQAAMVSTTAREPIHEFVAHACRHHEDAKQDYIRNMFRDAIGSALGVMESEMAHEASVENSANS